MEKIVLTDVDGVLCDWENGFNSFMESKGFKMIENGHLEYVIGKRFGIDIDLGYEYVREFNNSERILELEPLRDAKDWVKKIHDDLGFKFICVSSMSDRQEAMDRRSQYLFETFGDVWADYVYLDTGSDKDAILTNWLDSGYLWVEDKVENCVAGVRAGLCPILMDHEYNATDPEFDIHDFQRVKNWQAIYQLLSSN
jgi:FMN phosphatase YigB (HAD superfamily)